MKATMKCTLLTILFVITFVNADITKKLLSGKAVPLGPFDADVQEGNVSDKYTNLTNHDVTASTNARVLTDLLRKLFSLGIFPLPPLDPYTNNNLESYVLPLRPLLSGTVQFDNLEVTGAQQYFLNVLELRMRTDRLDYELTVPRLNVDVDVKANLLVSNFLPVVLEGKLKLRLDGVELVGALQSTETSFPESRVYQVTGAKTHLHVDNVMGQYVGKEVESDLWRSLDTVAEDASEASWAPVKEDVEKHVLRAVMKEMNNVLKHLSVYQVKAYLY